MELPTTEPGCEFFHQIYTESATEDDTEIEDMDGDFRTHRHRSRLDAIRKFSHAACETTCKMPPELIIKSAKKGTSDIIFNCKEKSPEKEPHNQQAISEFPAISTNNRRTKSWHYLNRTQTLLKPNNESAYDQSDSLQLKLSLKKKIWTGADVCPSRPLSWGIPQLMRMPIYDSDALLEYYNLNVDASSNYNSQLIFQSVFPKTSRLTR